jgi:O-antigen/teichoic acid export membrane protein
MFFFKNPPTTNGRALAWFVFALALLPLTWFMFIPALRENVLDAKEHFSVGVALSIFTAGFTCAALLLVPTPPIYAAILLGYLGTGAFMVWLWLFIKILDWVHDEVETD